MTLEGYLQKKFRNSFEESRRPIQKSASFRSLRSVKSRLSASRSSLKLQKSELSFGSRTSLDSSSSSSDSCPGFSSYSSYTGPSRAVITQVDQIKRNMFKRTVNTSSNNVFQLQLNLKRLDTSKRNWNNHKITNVNFVGFSIIVIY